MQPRRRTILAVALVTQGVAVGVTIGAFSLFVRPLEAEFEAARWQVSLGPGLMMLALAISGVFVGQQLDRGRFRRVMLIGGALLSLTLLLASQAPNLWVLGVLALMAGGGVPMIGPLAGISVVSRVFAEDRGRALGIVTMGPPLGIGLLASVAGWSLSVCDWRTTYLLFSILTAGITLPLIWLFIPEHVESAAEPNAIARPPLTLREISSSRLFWLTASVFALAGGVGSGWSTQFEPFFADAGLSMTEAATLIAFQAWIGVPGTLAFGALADRFRATRVYAGMLGSIVAIFVVFSLGVPVAGVVVLSLLFGLCSGGIIPLQTLQTLLTGQRFGATAVGRAMGLANLGLLPMSILCTLVAAGIHDATDHYELALAIFAVIVLAALICLWASNRRARLEHATALGASSPG
jgi:predicted MFS family arabinose efflux permease